MRQTMKGTTVVNVICYVSLASLALLTAAKLVPVYMQSMTVDHILENIATQKTERYAIIQNQAIKSNTRRLIERQFQTNDVRDVPLRDLSVIRQDNGYKIQLSYTRTVHFIGNISLSLAFDKSVVITREKQ